MRFETEKKGNNYFPGWKVCLAWPYFLHWFQAAYAYKHYAYKKNIKKDACNAKIKNIEDKIPDIANFATNTTLNAEIHEAKKWIT